MRASQPRQKRAPQLLLLLAAAFLAYLGIYLGIARAQVSSYVVINPIDVCLVTSNKTKTCAPFGASCTTQNNGAPSCTLFNNPVAATSSTPIGFVDQTTNINLTRAIWAQAGIDVVFLPIQEYDSPITCTTGPSCNLVPPNWGSAFQDSKGNSTWTNTDYLTLHVATNITTNFPSPDFAALTAYTLPSTNPSTTVSICPGKGDSCSLLSPVPLTANLTGPPNLTQSNAINVFFVNAIQDASGVSSYNGYTWINGNAIAIASNTFSQNAFDVLAHEIGHALNLTHTGPAGQGGPAPGTSCTGTSYPSYQVNTTTHVYENGCNLMDAGVYPPASCVNSPCPFRVIPTTTDCSALPSKGNFSPPFGGLQYDIDTMLCGKSAPSVAQADQILLGNSSSSQQGTVLSSGFIVPTANVPATATAGGGKAAATTTTATTTAAASSTNPITFSVQYPKFNGPNGSGGRSGEFIISLFLSLPANFSFVVGQEFTQIGTTPAIFGHSINHGNNGGGNSNCFKPVTVGGNNPNFQCLEIDFRVTESPPGSGNFTGSFTNNTTLTFTSAILDASNNSATLSELECTNPSSFQCLDLVYVFSDLLATDSVFAPSTSTTATANSRSPNLTVLPTIITDTSIFPNLPSDYPSFSGFPNTSGQLVPCTASNPSQCPPGNGPDGGG